MRNMRVHTKRNRARAVFDVAFLAIILVFTPSLQDTVKQQMAKTETESEKCYRSPRSIKKLELKLGHRVLRLSGGSEEAQMRIINERNERAAERRIIIERLKAEIQTTEQNQRFPFVGSEQNAVTDDQNNFTSADFFSYNDEVETEPVTVDNPYRGWDPAILDLEDRGSSFDAEQDLYVQTATEINPLYDEEYEQVQQEAVEQGLDPLPDRCTSIVAQSLQMRC